MYNLRKRMKSSETQPTSVGNNRKDKEIEEKKMRELEQNLDYMFKKMPDVMQQADNPLANITMAAAVPQPIPTFVIGTPMWSAQLALLFATTPLRQLSPDFIRSLNDPNNNPLDVLLTYKQTVPADNIVLAIGKLAQHDLAHFAKHHQGMIAEMQKNPAHSLIWAKAYIDTRSMSRFENPNQIIQNEFFRNSIAVMGKYYTIAKAGNAQAPVAIDNNLLVKTTQLIVIDKGITNAILALPNNAKIEDFANIVNTRYELAFAPEADPTAPTAKKQRMN
jgi:hypothetical protein